MVDAITNDYQNVVPFTDISIADGDSRRLGDVILAQLWPLTGSRSFGQAAVFATGSAPVTLPANSYAVPIVKGQAFEQKRVKVDWNPDTAKPHQQGGEWSVSPGGTLVTFKSNTGGGDMNHIAGSTLRFMPPIAGIAPTCVVQEPGFLGGTSGVVKCAVQFDDFPGTEPGVAALQSRLGAFPAMVLAWLQSQPVDGRTAGLAQGQTRKGRDTRFYFDFFQLYVIANNAQSGEQRRASALNIKDTAMDLLGDYNRNFDGEMLAFAGTGIEILDVKRITRTENTSVIVVNMRTVSTRNRVEFRSFNRWRATRYQEKQLAIPPTPPPDSSPGNPADLITGDQLDDMPQDS